MTARRPSILEDLTTLVDEDCARDVQVLLSPFSYHWVRCHCVLLLVYMPHEITAVTIWTAAELSTQTVIWSLFLKVTDDPVITKFHALFLIPSLLEASAAPVEANSHHKE